MTQAIVLLLSTLTAGVPASDSQIIDTAAVHSAADVTERRGETTKDRIARARARLGDRVRTSSVRRVVRADPACQRASQANHKAGVINASAPARGNNDAGAGQFCQT